MRSPREMERTRLGGGHAVVAAIALVVGIVIGMAEGRSSSQWRHDEVWLAVLGAVGVGFVLLGARRLAERRKVEAALAASEEALRASEEKARIEVELRRDAEKLDAANATLRVILDNTPISIGVVDAERKYAFGNKFFCDAYGISAADLVGRSPQMVFCSDADFEALGAAAYPVIAAGGIYDCEQKLRWADGSEYIARVIGRRIDPANPALGSVWVLDDLTDSKLAEAGRIKSEFLAMMSHEMRTPLNGIIGLLSAVGGLPEAAPLADTHAMIMDSASALLEIIGDLLDFALLERAEFHIAETDFDLLELIAGIESLHRDRTQAKGVAFAVGIAGDVPRLLRGDGIRLGQIVTNLVGNAVKFTEAGHVEVGVTACPIESGETVLTITVEDTGIGIPAETMKTLFQPFTQGDPSISRRYGGTGLGLAISRRLAQLMGGEITAESEVGTGSRFRVSLPFKVVAEIAAAEVVAPPPPLAMRRLAVLVAEDNPVSSVVAEKIVSRLGHESSAVGDGRAAVEAVKDGRCDLVLMDMRMPVMDGLAATRAIRALPAPLGEIPIVGVTANAFPQDIRDCLDAGMNAHLSKPITLAGLAATIERIME